MTPTHPTGKLCHTHVFDDGNPLAERNTRWATLLTAITMVVEIIGGWHFNSMALLADGWHMSSHALALGLSVFSYRAARRYAQDSRFAFGTWKIEILGGYTSALFLVGVALLMLYQSVARLISPEAIHYDEAITIAVVGLLVNLACAWLLNDSHDHQHGHSHEHGHTHAHHGKNDHDNHHHDLNLRSAYIHVITDAATSGLAIIALIGGKYWGASWLDPIMGIMGGILVAVWAYGLLRDCGKILLDAEMDAPVVDEVREIIAELPIGATLTDLHLWRVARGKYACIISISANQKINADEIRQQLSIHEELAHITVEVNVNNI